jgi:hypothetical protein
MAQRFGAHHVYNPEWQDIAAEIASPTESLTFLQASSLAGYSGRAVYVGYCQAPVTYQTQVFNLVGTRNAAFDDFAR